jgi:hypothetical protein
MISGARYSCVPMNDMDRALVGSALNSTTVGPPASPESLLDGFRLRRGRMRGMKAVEQEEEGCLPSRSRPCPPWSRPRLPPSLPREGDHVVRSPNAVAVASDLSMTNRRERESGFVWVGVCGQDTYGKDKNEPTEGPRVMTNT